MSTGISFRTADGGTFAASHLYNAIINKSLETSNDTYLPNSNVKVPFVFVADEAYLLTPLMIRPYSRRSLNTRIQLFNEHLSKARCCVVCVFGILTMKWRLLTKEMEVNIQTAKLVIETMCLLHNVVIDIEKIYDYYDIYDTNENKRNLVKNMRYNNMKNQAKEFRNKFTTFFVNKHGL